MICSFLMNNLRHMFLVLIFLCLRTILREPDRKKRKKGLLILHLKKQVFSTSILETSWWLVFHDWFPMKFVFTYNISLVWWEINSKQKKIKSSRKAYVMWTCFKFWPMKTINQWKFDYGLFTNLPRIYVASDFSPSSFKLRRGILPLLT